MTKKKEFHEIDWSKPNTIRILPNPTSSGMSLWLMNLEQKERIKKFKRDERIKKIKTIFDE